MYCGDLKGKEVQKGRDTYICMADSYIYMIHMIIYICVYIYMVN